MSQLTARILKASAVLADGVHAEVRTTQNRGLLSWHGMFKLEQMIPELINESGALQIQFSDGRAGTIVVTNIEMAVQPIAVTFQGSGPLK